MALKDWILRDRRNDYADTTLIFKRLKQIFFAGFEETHCSLPAKCRRAGFRSKPLPRQKTEIVRPVHNRRQGGAGVQRFQAWK